MASGSFSCGEYGPTTGSFTARGGDRATREAHEARDGLLPMTSAGGRELTAGPAFVAPWRQAMAGERALETRWGGGPPSLAAPPARP